MMPDRDNTNPSGMTPAQQGAPFPLVIDLDGTLTPTDTLVESVIKFVKQSPLNLLRLPVLLARGKAGFKDAICVHVRLAVAQLPYRETLLDYLRQEKEKGRRICLATAAHKTIADEVAAHLGLFDQVLATEAGRNLKGGIKLDMIRMQVGADFIYAGDSTADVPIWKAARGAILVGVAPGLAARVRRETPVEWELASPKPGLAVWLRALRVHQWLKNLLLFVPLMTAFSFLDFQKLAAAIIAFLAFSLAASATYMVNDLWDLESDRGHPRKRLRPFASGAIPIRHGIMVAAVALGIALILAFAVSKGFLAMLLIYLVVTSAYSWMLKGYVLIDVLVLSLLYALRILAGSVAVGISTSSWLLAFSVFIFLSLALVKRCSELVALGQNGIATTRGRDYRVSDLVVLWPLGLGAALSAVVVFGLFISAPETQARYGTPQLLWLAGIGLIYWLGRLWIKTSRGEMHDDPIIYAIKDRGCLITTCFMILSTLAAHFLFLGSIL